MVDVAGDQRGHPAAALAVGDVDVHAGVSQDRDDRLGQLLVEVVGEDVDEVGDPRAGLLRPGPGQPEPLGAADERGPVGRGSRRSRERPKSRSSQPARRAARHAGRCRGSGAGWRSATRCSTRESTQSPWRQPVVLDVGGLGLQHQARHVDPRRALRPAEVAVDAEVGVLLELLGPPELRVDRPGGELAEQVRLGAGGGGLGAGGPEGRAHPQGRLARPAGAAAVAGRGVLARLRDRASGSEDRSGTGEAPSAAAGVGRRAGEAAEVAGHQVRVVADDLAGVEQVQRVEGVLDLAEDGDQVAVLPAEELGAHQAAAVLARDRAAEVEGGLVDLASPAVRAWPGRAGSARSRNGRGWSWPSPAWASRVQLSRAA